MSGFEAGSSNKGSRKGRALPGGCEIWLLPILTGCKSSRLCYCPCRPAVSAEHHPPGQQCCRHGDEREKKQRAVPQPRCLEWVSAGKPRPVPVFLAAALPAGSLSANLPLARCPAAPPARPFFIDWAGLQPLGEMPQRGSICLQTGLGFSSVCCLPTTHAGGCLLGFPSRWLLWGLPSGRGLAPRGVSKPGSPKTLQHQGLRSSVPFLGQFNTWRCLSNLWAKFLGHRCCLHPAAGWKPAARSSGKLQLRHPACLVCSPIALFLIAGLFSFLLEWGLIRSMASGIGVHGRAGKRPGSLCGLDVPPLAAGPRAGRGCTECCCCRTSCGHGSLLQSTVSWGRHTFGGTSTLTRLNFWSFPLCTSS